MGEATSSPHTAAPLRVSPQEIPRVVAVGQDARGSGAATGAVVGGRGGTRGAGAVRGARRRYIEKGKIVRRIETEK